MNLMDNKAMKSQPFHRDETARTPIEMPPIGSRQLQVVMAPEKAAAFDSWIAQGGGIRQRGRGYRSEYRKGPMKGMTKDEAVQRFERMWESATPKIRAKYQRIAADSPAPATGNAALNSPLTVVERAGGLEVTRLERPGEMAERQKRSRILQYQGKDGLERYDAEQAKRKTAVSKPYDKDGNGVPDMIQRPAGVTATTATPAQGGDQTAQAMGTPEQQAMVAQMLKEGEQYASADNSGFLAPRPWDDPVTKGLKGMASGVVGAVSSIPSKMTTAQPGEAGYTPAPQPAAPQQAPAPTAAAPAPQPQGVGKYGVNPGRRGGVSVSGQQGRISTGASPSAPVEVRNQVAANAAVKPVMPDQIAPVAQPKAPAPATTATPAPRINKLTGLPFGYVPGDAVPAANQAAANESVGRQVAADPRMQPGGPVVQGPSLTPVTKAPAATPQDIAAADNAMRSSGLVVRTPAAPVTTVARPTGPTPRPDGYQAPSLQQDWQRERESAAARQSGTMGDYFRDRGDEQMAKAFPNRTENPAGMKLGATKPLDQLGIPRAIPVAQPAKRPMGTTVASPMGRPVQPVGKPVTSIARPAFAFR